MQTSDWIIIIILSLSLIILIILLTQSIRKQKNVNINQELTDFKNEILRNLKTEINTLQNYIGNLFNVFTNSQEKQNNQFSQNIEIYLKQMLELQSKSNQEIEQKLENIRKSVEVTINNLRENTDKRLENVRNTIEESLTKIQVENSKKLEEMRHIVDEKLQSTLNARISESFKTVNDSLEKVTRGLGEMQTLATGVGDLKKVLANVKTRGVLGEIQLGNILEEILIPEQYVTNYATKKGSRERVEFAIKLPGDSNPVYLPIDSKFPLEDYSRLLDAYDSADSDLVTKYKKNLVRTIKNFAKDISEKYIDVPNTTEFAIMFLPVEGLYAEVVNLGLLEDLQRNYKVNIAGPTTMAALLNSLQMGFKSLAIQQRSSEVWDTLAAVKTEFEKFESVLQSAQKKLDQANSDLSTLVGARTKQIQKKLKNVSTFGDYETKVLISDEED